MLADDLMAAVFPDAAACLENIPGDRQIPDHPLVNQTVRDCLQEAMDFEGLAKVLARIHAGDVELVSRDTPEPSFFAHEILNAKPYAFLDDAPLEERRAHAVQSRRAGDPARGGDLGHLDATAIDRVRTEALPEPRDADELHDALLTAGFLTPRDIAGIPDGLFEELVSKRRACAIHVRTEHSFAIAAERLPEWLAIDPAATLEPRIEAPASRRSRVWMRADALVEMLRGRLTITGPITAPDIAESLGISEADVNAALLALEADGAVLRGQFFPRIPDPESRTPDGNAVIEWCDRSLLSRIHRYTLNRLRAEIEPVSPADFMRFLFSWQHVEPAAQLTSIDGLREIVAMLDGFELAASAWERAVLPARMRTYDPQLLDMLCLAGEVAWARLSVPTPDQVSPARLVPATPVALFLREHADMWQRLRHGDEPQSDGALGLSIHGQLVLDLLKTRGASFFNDLVSACALDADAVRQAIGALVAAGYVASDGFSGLRALVSAANGVPPSRDRRTNFAGRWTALEAGRSPESRDADVEALARTLLRRYGVVFRRVLTREPAAAPWRELTHVYRRLEARGEIRGGRFVAGMSGEQFALPEAVDRLRDVRRTPADGHLLTISAADPLNLAGVITAGDRIRTAPRTRIVYRDGVPLAVMEGDFTRELTAIDPAIAGDVARALSRRRVPALLR
jgi:ATP-dependent Lhr-like helicase